MSQTVDVDPVLLHEASDRRAHVVSVTPPGAPTMVTSAAHGEGIQFESELHSRVGAIVPATLPGAPCGFLGTNSMILSTILAGGFMIVYYRFAGIIACVALGINMVLLLACMIAAFNQLDGINAVIYYTADIFRMAGADKAGALMQSVIVGLTNLVMTLVAMALIDRVGRKALLLAGSVTFVFSHALAAWVFYTHAQGWIVIAALMGIVGSHAYSQGAVVWVYINEILPNAIRASGSAVICFMLWVLCAAVSWSFPVLAGISTSGPFVFFALMMVLQFVLILKFLPETKGRSLEELQQDLGIQD